MDVFKINDDDNDDDGYMPGNFTQEFQEVAQTELFISAFI